MKTMTCNQLAGACDMAFHADTWEEMAKKLDALVEGGPHWNSLAEAGRQVAKNVYHPTHTAKQLLSALTSMKPG